MNVEIITIGDELLIGQVIDTNSAWMGENLNLAGFKVSRKTAISDDRQEILSMLKDALQRVDIVLITGGLGPTRDDITKKVLAEFFNSPLVLHQEVYNDVADFLSKRNIPMSELNTAQALVPECCTAIRNSVGTAPIMWFDYQQKVVVSMPGVPSEMVTAMQKDVIPKLQKTFKQQSVIHRTLNVYGIGESTLAESLTQFEDNLPTSFSLAYLPAIAKVRLRLTASGDDAQSLSNQMDKLVLELTNLVKPHLAGIENESLEELIGKELGKRNLTLSTAESCSGGNIAHHITSVPGASQYFKGGVVAYDNWVKSEFLSVSEADLTQFGAVSQQVVEQMALGVKSRLKTDCAIATSGIAGPSGGTELKPVGTIWIAIAGPWGVKSKVFQMGNIRNRNIERSTIMSMFLFLKELELL